MTAPHATAVDLLEKSVSERDGDEAQLSLPTVILTSPTRCFDPQVRTRLPMYPLSGQTRILIVQTRP
jgi:hypothetical protein